MVVGTMSVLVVLSSIIKQAELARGSGSVKRTLPWPLNQLLPPCSSPA